MKLLETVTNLGVKQNHPTYQQKKIKLSNQINLFHIGIALFYIIFDAILFPTLTFIPVVGLGIGISNIILARLYLTYATRFMSALLPMMLAALFNAYLTTPEDPPLAGMLALEMAFLLLPYLLFDFREKAYLAVSSLIGILIVSTYRFTSGFFVSSEDPAIIKLPGVETVTIVAAILLIIGYIIVLLNQGRTYENRSQRLIEAMDSKNEELEQAIAKADESMRELEAKQEQEKQVQWATNGLAEFSGTMRRYNSVEELYYNTLSLLVNYLGANQGGLFVLNDEDKTDQFLEMKACYAYSKKKYLNKRIAIGEGLVGQTFLEKEYNYLTNIPQYYVNITSGLGEATPNAIVVMPMIDDEEVVGVFELATFDKFEPYQLAFLEKLSTEMASTIRNIKVNERIRRLYQQSESYTEEMQLKESKYMQEIAELEQENRSLKKQLASQSGEVAKMKSIQESFAKGLVTFNESGQIIAVDYEVADLFGYTREEMLEKTVADLFPTVPELQEDPFLFYFNHGFQQEDSKALNMQAHRKDASVCNLRLLLGMYEEEAQVYFVGVVTNFEEQAAASRNAGENLTK